MHSEEEVKVAANDPVQDNSDHVDRELSEEELKAKKEKEDQESEGESEEDK